MRGVYHGIHSSEARRAAEAGQKGKQAASGQCFTKRFVTIRNDYTSRGACFTARILQRRSGFTARSRCHPRERLSFCTSVVTSAHERGFLAACPRR